jgi:AhpD family alkylhydroperoxidase
VTKELLAIALGLAVHCEPCTRIHIKKARSMGIGAAEMEEAAALAVAFAGCRALMLWNALKRDCRKVHRASTWVRSFVSTLQDPRSRKMFSTTESQGDHSGGKPHGCYSGK